MNARLAPKPDPRIGMVLQDRYRILRKIGDGGMGSVYEGEHLLIKRRVAIKVLHAHFADNPDVVARFRREAEAATTIGHPNIIEVTDMGSFPDGTAYMVLEFLQGRDWSKDIATQGPQPLGKVVHIVSQICDALSTAHAKGIVHRDLKPDNIFLIERGGDPDFAKVLDFGISKFADPSGGQHSLTQTGTAIGTPYYMAPEQCQGKKDIDHRADIYSLGVILFQALTRQYPFDDESYPMLVLKICTEPPPPLAHYRPDLPPEVIAIIDRMLAKDRRQRFASCAEVKAALEPFRHLNAAPVVAANAPNTASRGPAVLERAASPASVPSVAQSDRYDDSSTFDTPQLAPTSKRTGLIWAIVAALFVLVLTGGAFGTLLALGAFSSKPPQVRGPEREQPELADATSPTPTSPTSTSTTSTSTTPTKREPVDEQPVATGEETEPTSPPVGTPPPSPPTVRLEVTVQGPPTAEIFIDGASWGTVPNGFDLPRDDPPTAGEAPRLHAIEVRAEGWKTASAQVPFTSAQQRNFVMERASRRTNRDVGRPRPEVHSFGGPQPMQGGSFGQSSTPPPRPGGGGGLVGVGNILR